MLPKRTPVSARALAVALALAVLPSLSARADVKLPAVFSSHMVLQREKPAPVWGQASAGEKVTVRFRDQEQTTTAGDDGRWSVALDKLKAGGPDTLIVEGANKITLDDVLVGEVWIGSGQSNMAGGVSSYLKGDEVLAKLASQSYPTLRLCRGAGGGWSEATPQTIPGFSALLFSFGQQLNADLDVPVGLIVGAVGGTPSGNWLSPEMLAQDADAQKALKQSAASDDFEARLAQYERVHARWRELAEAAKQKGERVPGEPRKPVAVGEINRGSVGNLYARYISPVAPFAIRGVLWDQGESGTAIQGLDQYATMGALIRGWRAAFGQGDFPFLYVQKPSGGGCAWDDADPVTREADAFTPLPLKPPTGGEGASRELHLSIRNYPQTFMVAARDLGSGIHPINKSGYGQRAARVALGAAYGQDVEIYGPIYQSHKVEGSKVRVKFDHVGKGLAWKHGEALQGFQVAGEDRVFHWADATIDGDAVIVSSDKVAKPVAVRYAWASRSPWANLFNKDGLPAATFRTDSW
ncbi:MAG: sialate O-acetylesterase [Pirellulaceae bacterium]